MHLVEFIYKIIQGCRSTKHKIQHMHIYVYVQSHMIIFQQNVSATPMIIIRVTYNNSKSVFGYVIIQTNTIRPLLPTLDVSLLVLIVIKFHISVPLKCSKIVCVCVVYRIVYLTASVV